MWQEYETVVYKLGHHNLASKIKFMGFDYDNTLHISDRCETYVTNKYVWAYDKIPEYFQKLHQNNYIIAIFSNRSSKYGLTALKKRLEELEKECQVPISIFLSTAYNQYRKPNIGMLELFKHLTNVKEINGYFCGDAAGENSDHPAHRKSDSDIGFAKNANLLFCESHKIFDRFPNQIIPSCRCLVTVGVYHPFRVKEDYVINNIRYICTEEYNPKLDYQIVSGQHPKFSDRKMPVESVILWYPKLDGEHHDKNFSQNFEPFYIGENYIRMN